ncbi:MAG: CotH kinase family protein [Lachnospiraceae bacterium]|nr:CotH kinase family protein [Lachnospiraceae bacterium]
MFGFNKFIKKAVIYTAVMLLSICFFGTVCSKDITAADTDPGIYVYIPFGEGRSVNIFPISKGEKNYLFLPSSMSPSGVIFHYDTEKVSVTFTDGNILESDKVTDITPYLSADTGDGSRTVKFAVTKNGVSSEYELHVMQSSDIPGIYINSSDKTRGREFVDESKSNKGSGTLTMITEAGNVVYDGELTQIKARGNTTFNADKKAYQIKLGSSVDLTQSAGTNANKTWILLANAYDPTLIHNTCAYDMASAFGLNSPDCRPVDLYYDGAYRGNYLLCEKVQVGTGRVDIPDLSKDNEKANPDKDLDKLSTATGANSYGNIYQYVTGMKTPEKYDGGYLLELDTAYYKGERCYFITSTGVAFTVKSPENCSKEEMIYISEYVEEIVRASLNGGVCPDNEKSLWDYIDIKSLARFFVLQETVANADSFSSSNYFYLRPDGSAMMAGPVWDFDDSFGIREDRSSTEGFIGGAFIEPFMNLPEFRKEVKKFVNSNTYNKATGGKVDSYVSKISASQKMNRILWNESSQMFNKLESYDADVAYMKNFASGRVKWLKGVFATW